MPSSYRKRMPDLSRREQRGASSRGTCSCGKHTEGGCTKMFACGSRSSKAYANSNSRVGRGARGHRVQRPGLLDEAASDALFLTSSWYSHTYNPCGCSACCASAWSCEELLALAFGGGESGHEGAELVAECDAEGASSPAAADEWVLVPREVCMACDE